MYVKFKVSSIVQNLSNSMNSTASNDSIYRSRHQASNTMQSQEKLEPEKYDDTGINIESWGDNWVSSFKKMLGSHVSLADSGKVSNSENPPVSKDVLLFVDTIVREAASRQDLASLKRQSSGDIDASREALHLISTAIQGMSKDTSLASKLNKPAPVTKESLNYISELISQAAKSTEGMPRSNSDSDPSKMIGFVTQAIKASAEDGARIANFNRNAQISREAFAMVAQRTVQTNSEQSSNNTQDQSAIPDDVLALARSIIEERKSLQLKDSRPSAQKFDNVAQKANAQQTVELESPPKLPHALPPSGSPPAPVNFSLLTPSHLQEYQVLQFLLDHHHRLQ